MSADVVEVQVDRKNDTVTVLMKLRSTVDKEARLVRARPVPVKELARNMVAKMKSLNVKK